MLTIDIFHGPDGRIAEDVLRAVYIEELGWLSNAQLSMMDDRYHPHSKYVVAFLDGTPTGFLRIVHDSPVKLPVEQFVEARNLVSGHTIEIQRLMVHTAARHRRLKSAPFGLTMALFKATMHYGLSMGVDTVLADVFLDTPTTPIRQLAKLGFEMTTLRFVDWELAERSESTVMRLSVSDLVSNIYCTHDRLHGYLHAHDDSFAFYKKLPSMGQTMADAVSPPKQRGPIRWMAPCRLES